MSHYDDLVRDLAEQAVNQGETQEETIKKVISGFKTALAEQKRVKERIGPVPAWMEKYPWLKHGRVATRNGIARIVEVSETSDGYLMGLGEFFYLNEETGEEESYFHSVFLGAKR